MQLGGDGPARKLTCYSIDDTDTVWDGLSSLPAAQSSFEAKSGRR